MTGTTSTEPICCGEHLADIEQDRKRLVTLLNATREALRLPADIDPNAIPAVAAEAHDASRNRGAVMNGLTDAEHEAMVLTATLWNTLCRIAGNGPSRAGDLAELATHIHAIQHAVMAQAAARAHPDMYRLMGGALLTTTQEGTVQPCTDDDVTMVALALAEACPTPEQCADTHDDCMRRNGIHWLSVGPGGLGDQHITAVEGDPRAIARIVLAALAAAGRLA